MEQYDYYGTLSGGYINSVFAQKNCLKTTDGYNYLAMNDDIYLYTGLTSIVNAILGGIMTDVFNLIIPSNPLVILGLPLMCVGWS